MSKKLNLIIPIYLLIALPTTLALQGTLEYMPRHNYTININETTITLTHTEQNNTIKTNYLPGNHFIKKINNVWFTGHFTQNQLTLEQYITTGQHHQIPAQQTSPTSWQSTTYLSHIPFIHLPFPIPITIHWQEQATAYVPWVPHLQISSPINNGVTAKPIGNNQLIQAQLTQNNTIIELSQWVKHPKSWTVQLS